MKTTVKHMTGNIEVIIESQNRDEDVILQDIYNTGNIIAMGQTQQERIQLILSTPAPRP